MSDRRFKRFARQGTCTCNECAELDIHHPGEGRQLALGLGDMGPLEMRVAPQPGRLS